MGGCSRHVMYIGVSSSRKHKWNESFKDDLCSMSMFILPCHWHLICQQINTLVQINNTSTSSVCCKMAKYLWITIDCNMSLSDQIRNTTTKTMNETASLGRLMSNIGRHLSSKNRLQLSTDLGSCPRKEMLSWWVQHVAPLWGTSAYPTLQLSWW